MLIFKLTNFKEDFFTIAIFKNLIFPTQDGFSTLCFIERENKRYFKTVHTKKIYFDF